MHTLQLTFRQDDGPSCDVSIRLLDNDVLVDEAGPYKVDLALPGNFREEIAWYLEQFREEVDKAANIRANRTKRAVSEWGRQLFRQVLRTKPARRVWDLAQSALSDTDIQIYSTEPGVDQIPWEILQDPHSGRVLSLSARSFIRCPVMPKAPTRGSQQAGPTRVLFVICRPSGTEDVSFRSIASKVFQQIQSNSGFEITVLRPATFSRCAQILRDSNSAGNPFDIVHFDGHGLHLARSEEKSGSGLALAAGGYIVFEDEGSEDYRLISGQDFGALMAETAVNAVVLNACRSAHVGASGRVSLQTESLSFVSSFAHDLVRLGTPSVVAMQYNVYVSSAARFNEELYRQLGRGQPVSVAASLARKHLASDLRRDAEIDSSAIPDWIVPAVFRNGADIPVARAAQRSNTAPAYGISAFEGSLPPNPDLGFIGADDALLAIDRAFDTSNVVLLSGLAGAGKSAASVEFGRWYSSTKGVTSGVLFTSFERPRTLEEVIATLEPLARRTDWSKVGLRGRRQAAIETLARMSVLWIWDNVETSELLSNTDRQELLAFLKDAAAAGAKFLLTARNHQEDWLYHLPQHVTMPPFRFSESVEFCKVMIRHLGRTDVDVGSLAPILHYAEGNPLTLYVVIAAFLGVSENRPDRKSARAFVRKLEAGESSFIDDPSHGRTRSLAASLQYGFGLSFKASQLKILSILHQFRRYVHPSVLFMMGHPPHNLERFAMVDYDVRWTLRELSPYSEAALQNILAKAARSGLLTKAGSRHFWMHPAIQLHLKHQFDEYYDSTSARQVQRAFSESIGIFSIFFTLGYTHGARKTAIDALDDEEDNLHYALSLSRRNGWWQAEIGVLHGLFTLSSHKGRLTQWAEILASVVPDFIDDSLQPLPGREKWWSFIVDHMVRTVQRDGDLARAEVLARAILDKESHDCVHISRSKQKALSKVDQHKLRFLGISFGRLADIQRERGNPNCVRLNHEALRLYRLVEDRPGISIRLFNLGHVYKNLKELRDLQKAARYYRKAYNSYPKTDTLGRAQCLGQLGSVSLALVHEGVEANAEQRFLWKHLESAIGYYQTVLEIMPSDALIDIAQAHNQLGAAYHYLPLEAKRALDHFKAAARFFEAAGEVFQNAGARLNAAQVLHRMSRVPEAYVYATEAIRILKLSNYQGPHLAFAKRLLARLQKDKGKA